MKEAATRIRNSASTGIRRTDNDRNGTHGWVVHVQRRSRVFNKCFSDGAYGGKAQAYRAAIKHRDEIITNHPPFTRGEYVDILRTNNTSGVPGVCKYKPSDGAKCWIAFWPTALGKTKRVKFSVNKYGDTKAFDLAVSAREHAIAKLTEPFKRLPSSRPERERPKTTKALGPDVRFKRVSIGRYRIRVELNDERVIAVPLWWFPRLHKTSVQAREQWTLNHAADTIIWENLGVTIKARQLMVGG